MIKTIVIGAGVMGASVAYRLAQAGAAVTVLEATRIGGGTSGISFAWTNAHNKPPKPYHDLNVAGMKAHAALAEEFDATPWWHGGGSLEWATRRWRFSRKRVGSIQWSTRMPCCPLHGFARQKKYWAMPVKRYSKPGRKRAQWRRTSWMRVVARPDLFRSRLTRTH